MRLHSAVELITNSSSEIYGTVNGYSEKRIREVVDVILETVGYAERFDDLFEIRYIPHQLFLSSRIEEFEDLYREYEIEPTVASTEEIDELIKRYTLTPNAFYFPRYWGETLEEKARTYLEITSRRLLLFEALMEADVQTIFEDGEYLKPVYDIEVVPKRGDAPEDIAGLMKAIWDWETWDWN